MLAMIARATLGIALVLATLILGMTLLGLYVVDQSSHSRFPNCDPPIGDVLSEIAAGEDPDVALRACGR